MTTDALGAALLAVIVTLLLVAVGAPGWAAAGFGITIYLCIPLPGQRK